MLPTILALGKRDLAVEPSAAHVQVSLLNSLPEIPALN
jgi:hypothetical protein